MISCPNLRATFLSSSFSICQLPSSPLTLPLNLKSYVVWIFVLSQFSYPLSNCSFGLLFIGSVSTPFSLSEGSCKTLSCSLLLLFLYTMPVQFNSTKNFSYVDNSQICFSTTHLSTAQTKISACPSDISLWMSHHQVKLHMASWSLIAPPHQSCFFPVISHWTIFPCLSIITWVSALIQLNLSYSHLGCA